VFETEVRRRLEMPDELRLWHWGRAVTVARFVTDSSLDGLARRLRILGFDVVTLRGARLATLFEAAARDGRIVLTHSLRHPRRHAGVPSLTLARGDPGASLRAVSALYRPASPPFSRCPRCNAPLRPRSVAEARDQVPPAVAARATRFHQCPQCGKWYWSGSHVTRMREWVEPLVDRSTPDLEAEGGDG
jgi:uncharacterized protein with PIN domain